MHTLEQLQSGSLIGTQHLKLACGLTEFPKEIYALADTLELLDLSGNQLFELPDDMFRFKKLKIAFFSDNLFTEFPKSLGPCPELEMIGFKANQILNIAEGALPAKTRWLILTNNQIKTLPRSIGSCIRMQKLMLAGNQLESLPEEMAHCVNIELLRISANRFQSLPDWLLDLPKLSWLAYAGNVAFKHLEPQGPLAEIAWSDLLLADLLGEGASGHIYKGTWLSQSKEVAIKVFKGEVTSDGLPHDEMNACMAAGTHPNLVQVLGKIVLHPDQKQGLVLGLIPPTFKNLGGPPNFVSCTRDNYPQGTLFTSAQALQVAKDSASVLAHLHDKGIMHGDFYAHNILVDPAYNALIGDFGAGTLFDKSQIKLAKAFEKLEVRAYGCLLDDLVQHLDPTEQNSAAFKTLLRLRDKCMDHKPGLRPSFLEILLAL